MPSSSREEEVCPFSPKKEGAMTMVIFFLSSVWSCGGDHGIMPRETEVCPSSSEKDKEYDHGHLPSFLSRELWRWVLVVVVIVVVAVVVVVVVVVVIEVVLRVCTGRAVHKMLDPFG